MKNVHKLYLYPYFFTSTEQKLYQDASATITTFLYESGVEAVRITIGKGQFIWLPFLGQQLFDWKVNGKSQKFTGFMDEPSYNKSFLENYGAFLIHCGITAMGNPKIKDSHIQHGELPIAVFDDAWIECNAHDDQHPISLHGTYHWKIPFKGEYIFSVSLAIALDGLSVLSDITIKNCSHTPLEYMYLCHINFDFLHAKSIEYGQYPFNNSRLRIIGDDVYKQDPSKLLTLHDEMVFDPEVVAVLHHEDSTSLFTSKLIRSDGSMCWVTQDTKNLNHTVLWMTHNQDRGACGFALPSTAGPEGKNAESNMKNVRTLCYNEEVTLHFSFGIVVSE